MKNPHVESRQSASHCKGAVYILLLSSIVGLIFTHSEVALQDAIRLAKRTGDLKPEVITSAVSFTVRNDIMLSSGVFERFDAF